MVGNRGSAYVFVLVIVSAVTGLLFVSLSIASMQVDLGKSYKNYTNLYDLAVTGVEKGVVLLNNELDSKRKEITAQAIEDLKTYEIEALTYYEAFGGFEGAFHLKRKNTITKIGEKDVIFSERFAIDADKYISGIGTGILQQPISFGFDMTIDEPEHSDVTYTVSVTLAADRTKTPNQYRATSTAVRTDTGARKTVVGEIKINYQGVQEEIYIPNYAWKTKPSWASFGIVSSGEIEMKALGALDTRFAEVTGLPTFNLSLLENSSFQRDNPVFISNTASQINVSDFYVEDKPTPVVVIAKQTTEPVILYGEEGKNRFKGILYSPSEAGLTIQNVVIEGTVIAASNVTIENTDPDSIVPNPDVLFALRFGSGYIANQKRLFDGLGISRFARSPQTVEKVADLDNLFYHIKPVGIQSLEINNANAIRFRIVGLTEQR